MKHRNHMKQCGVGMYVNRVYTAQTSCFHIYAVCGTKGPRRFMQNILSGIQDHITVPRVHPDRIGLQRQERSWRTSL